MKIRNGFVSNSSSSSFVLIANTKPQNSKKYGKTFTRTSSRTNHETVTYDDYETFNVPDFKKEENYCRGNILWLRSIADKIKYVIAMYAYYYQHDKNFFEKILSLRDKIFDLGIKHWYAIGIPIPQLSARWDYDWDDALDDWDKSTRRVETFVNIYTECDYVRDIVDMVEAEDDSRLDSFLFNEDSFAVLGGDEYSETYALQRKAVEFLNKRRKEVPNFSYTLIADWTEHDADDIDYVDENGVEHKYGYSSHWEEDCFKEYAY